YPRGIGLFGQADLATIRNVTLENVNLTVAVGEIPEASPVGALLGRGYGVTLENISVSGQMSVVADLFVSEIPSEAIFGYTIGGIVGELDSWYGEGEI